MCFPFVKPNERDLVVQNFELFRCFIFDNFVSVAACSVEKGIAGVKFMPEIEGQPIISWGIIVVNCVK